MTLREPGSRVLEIDGLRGIAALSVALYHIHPQGTHWLWSFVDCFFVISGYVITSMLLRLERWDAISLRNFWVRRVIRIWPVYYLTLATVSLLWIVWQIRHGQDLHPFSGFYESTIFAQYLFGTQNSLAPGENYLWWFGHSWSLAVEEQYYLVWPLLLWGMRSRPAFCACMLLVFYVAVIWVKQVLHLPQYLLVTRGDGLALGSLIAVSLGAVGLSPSSERLFRILPPVLFAASVAQLWPYLAHGGGDLRANGSANAPLMFSCAYASLICVILLNQFPALNRLLRSKILVYLGSISYAVYMFHVPIQKLLDQFFNAGLIESRALVEGLFWILLLSCAALSRRFLELPAEHAKVRFPLRFKHPSSSGLNCVTPKLSPE